MSRGSRKRHFQSFSVRNHANRWRLLLWPSSDGELAMFMQRLTITEELPVPPGNQPAGQNDDCKDTESTENPKNG